MRIAFDVDDTLIQKDLSGRDVPRYEVIELLRWFVRQKHQVFVWSGGGVEYAKQVAERLGLPLGVSVLIKDDQNNIDISVDDMDVELAKVNIKV